MKSASNEVRDDAYHVTATANLTSIAAGGFRTDGVGLLGSGAYFDLGTHETGWAIAHSRYPGQPLVVFRCEVDMGRVLDLDDDETRLRFVEFQRTYVLEVGREEALRIGQGGHLDAFFDTLGRQGEHYNTVIRTSSRTDWRALR